MARPVTTDGTVGCSHGGTARPAGGGKLMVAGVPVVTYDAVPGLTSYSGCTFSDNSGNKPCTSTAPGPSGRGKAGKLLIGGKPALLDDLDALTAPGPGSVTVTAGQTLLKAV